MQSSRSIVVLLTAVVACSPKPPEGAAQIAQPSVSSPHPVTIPSRPEAPGPFGPFGLSMGMSLEALQKLGTIVKVGDGYIFKLTSPNARFAQYALVITEKEGLCRIGAITKSISTSAYGEKVRGEFDAMREALEKRYGTAALAGDILQEGSIWSEPREYMTSLRKRERLLKAFWVDKSAPVELKGPRVSLPNHLQVVSLDAMATADDAGVLMVGYEFTNSQRCATELMEAKAADL